MKVKIGRKNVELKWKLRSLLMYENITDESFSPKTLQDLITYLYCVVVSSSGDYDLTYDKFIEEIDDQPTIIAEFKDWLENVVEVQEKLKKK